MSDWEMRQQELRGRLDRRAERIERLRAQGLHELADREDRATQGEVAELNWIIAEMARKLVPTPSPAPSPCNRCGGSGWVYECCGGQPCPACNAGSPVSGC
jgi:hypothetical protein